MKWIDFMEENYPYLVKLMRLHHKFLTIARKVDGKADRYREFLDKQYIKSYSRSGFFCLIYLTNDKNYCIIKLSIISLKGEFL